jgi:alpha-tubulin suppressor-like RCC1 family protein
MSTYEFKGKFTSSMEAKGTVKIDQTAYSWTATPATANGTPLPTEISATETETLQSASETLQPTATPTFPPLMGLKAVAAGYRHTCSLTSSGGVKCWGYNVFGELGDGTRTDSMIPVDVRGLSEEVTAIAMGSGHTCVLTLSGGVKCWGDDSSGELGQGTIELVDGSRMDSVIPVDVIGLPSGVTAIAAGKDHTCALTSSGGVKCWGDNGSGELGNGTTTLSNIPVDVTGLSSGVMAIAAGSNYTCALTSSGEVKCWGQNEYGQLGDGTTTNSSIPVDVVGLSNGIVAITAGGSHSCALTSEEVVMCWGWNSNGQLGNQSDTDSSVPVKIIGLSSGVISLSAGDMHTCALTSDGGVKCWGYNHFGQLGDGTSTASNVPVDVNGLSGQVIAISLGSGYTCALITGGGVKCWGENEFGKLGDGTTTNSSVPVDVIM